MERRDICKPLIDWIMLPKIYGYLKPHNMTLLWNGTFAKCDQLRLGYIELWWYLNPITSVLEEKNRRRKRPFNNRGRNWSKHQSRNTKDCQKSPETRTRHGTDSPRTSTRNQFCQYVDFWFVRKYISVVLSAPVIICYGIPRKPILYWTHLVFSKEEKYSCKSSRLMSYNF